MIWFFAGIWDKCNMEKDIVKAKKYGPPQISEINGKVTLHTINTQLRWTLSYSKYVN